MKCGPSQGEPLGHALGEPANAVVGRLTQSYVIQKSMQCRDIFMQPVHPSGELEVFEGGQFTI